MIGGDTFPIEITSQRQHKTIGPPPTLHRKIRSPTPGPGNIHCSVFPNTA